MRRHARGDAVAIAHQDGLDHVGAADLEQRLPRRSAVGGALVQDLDAYRKLRGETLAELRRDVRHLLVGRRAFPELRPELRAPEPWLAPCDETLGELFAGQVVDGRHALKRRFSAPPSMFAATTSWLHALQTCPAPLGPIETTVDPIASKSGRARAKASSGPPTMIESVPSIAPRSPPETGASSIEMPRSSSASAI